jgi:hypothetical protein
MVRTRISYTLAMHGCHTSSCCRVTSAQLTRCDPRSQHIYSGSQQHTTPSVLFATRAPLQQKRREELGVVRRWLWWRRSAACARGLARSRLAIATGCYGCGCGCCAFLLFCCCRRRRRFFVFLLFLFLWLSCLFFVFFCFCFCCFCCCCFGGCALDQLVHAIDSRRQEAAQRAVEEVGH